MMQIRSFGIVTILCAVLFLTSCTTTDPFAGDWIGSGVDSQGNEFTFTARITALGDDYYRVLILDKLDTTKEPMHVMDGILKDDVYEYTADEGLYKGGGILIDDVFSGFYKGPVDGTFTMQRIIE